MRATLVLPAILILCLSAAVLANSAPVVSNVRASQRADGSKLVDIYYDLADVEGDTCAVWAVASNNGGLTWHIPIIRASGHVGNRVMPGASRHVVWDAMADMPGNSGGFKIRVFAADGSMPDVMVLMPAGEFPYQGNQLVKSAK